MTLRICFILALLAIDASLADDGHWGYPNLEKDEDFPKWGGICDTGKHQSPINLSVRGALKGEFEKLDFEHYEEKQGGVEIVNNGHTIQLSHFPHEMELKGGPLLDEFVVEQIHLHWWSEHTVDNVRYPLEVHIVHRNKRYPNMTMAANFKDGITVIGVLYVVSNERNEAIDKIASHLSAVKSYKQINQPTRMEEAFSVRDLFPDVNGYFTYAGSLTTPSCAESVTWIVLHHEFPVTLDQIDKFKEIEFDEGKALRNNYRTIQRANNRPVIVILASREHSPEFDAAPTLQVSIAVMILAAIFAKFLQ